MGNDTKATAPVATAAKKGGPKGPRVTVDQMLEKLVKAGGPFAKAAEGFKASAEKNEAIVKVAKQASKDLRKKVSAAVKAIAALA